MHSEFHFAYDVRVDLHSFVFGFPVAVPLSAEKVILPPPSGRGGRGDICFTQRVKCCVWKGASKEGASRTT